MKIFIRTLFILGFVFLIAYFVLFFRPLSIILFGKAFFDKLNDTIPFINYLFIPGIVCLGLPYFIYFFTKSAFPLSKNKKNSTAINQESRPNENTISPIVPVNSSLPTAPSAQLATQPVPTDPNALNNPSYQSKNLPSSTTSQPSESFFDGSLIQLIGYKMLGNFLLLITLGIAYPWIMCMIEGWDKKHTVINGNRLKFNGTGGQLIGNYLKWIFLSIITLTIYAWFIPIKIRKWKVKHTILSPEN